MKGRSWMLPRHVCLPLLCNAWGWPGGCSTMKWFIQWTGIFASSNCLQVWDRAERESSTGLLALVQSLRVLLWREWVSLYPCASRSRAAKGGYSQSLWEQKILPVRWGVFLGQGSAVRSGGGWLHLGNIALNIPVMVSNCRTVNWKLSLWFHTVPMGHLWGRSYERGIEESLLCTHWC